jgi:hypothetical protein
MTPLLKKVAKAKAKAKAKATASASTTANTGILHCVQNDGIGWGGELRWNDDEREVQLQVQVQRP